MVEKQPAAEPQKPIPAVFGLRYDFRCPSFASVEPIELYQEALEQSAWADEHGFAFVSLAEHHGAADGYLPAPLLIAAAVAARTRRIGIMVASLIVPLHDPVRLAEDLAVLDLISGGRVIPVLAGGYMEREFAMFGRQLAERRERLDEIVPFLEKAWQGEATEYRGRPLRVLPRPHSKPRPSIWMGGSSPAAARRAARYADSFLPNKDGLYALYQKERQALGRPAAADITITPLSTFLAQDPELHWQQLAPHLIYETNCYARWAREAGVGSPYVHVEDLAQLKSSGLYRVLRPEELLQELRASEMPPPVMFHPLVAGLELELGRQTLRLLEEQVLPQLA